VYIVTFFWVLPFESIQFLAYIYVNVFRLAVMENDAGEFVDLYCPRKWWVARVWPRGSAV